MRLFEITTSRWFVALAEKQKPGSTIERLGSTYPLGGLLEGHLERRRPERCLPRANCFYLTGQPPSKGAYVYEVEPVGSIDRQHTSWIRLLRDAVQTNIGEVDHFAGGYWSGEEVPELREAPWEHRVAKVKVLKQIVAPGPRPTSVAQDGTCMT